MLKEILAISMLSSVINVPYVGVSNIEAYQNNETYKQIEFEFTGSFISVNDFKVDIDAYDSKGDYKGRYSNGLAFIGNKKAKARIDFGMDTNFYILIDVYNKENLIVKDAKLNFYIQDNCLIDLHEKTCKRIYKSEYSNGISKDTYINFKANDNVFNKFLVNNKLRLEDIKFNSEYGFENGSSYLLIEEIIEEYELNYLNGYVLPLEIEKDNYYNFVLINDYYVDLKEFKYAENKFNNGIKTNGIHFPFNKEYKEYECLIVVEDFIDIYIKFNIGVSDELLGNCASSKYCLKRGKYD